MTSWLLSPLLIAAGCLVCFAPGARADKWPFATASTGVTTWFVAPTANIAAGGMPGISAGGGVVAGGNWKINAKDGFAVGLRVDTTLGIDAFGGAIGGTVASTSVADGAVRSYFSVSPRFLLGRDWVGRDYWGVDLRHGVSRDGAPALGFVPPTFFIGIGYYKREVSGGSYFWDTGIGF